MWKLSLARNALNSKSAPLDPIRRIPARFLSTEGEQQQQPQDPPPISTEGEQQPDRPLDPFLRTPGDGWVFGRLTGIGRNTKKTDIIHFLEGCNLSTDDVKVEYSRAYAPVGTMLQFSSGASFDMALRQCRRTRLYKLDMVDRSQWDHTISYDGKSVLLQGIPRNALQEDVERFLHGCNFDASTIQIFFRTVPVPVRCALVQFQTRIDAMNAFAVKNRGFCLNNPIMMRVLH